MGLKSAFKKLRKKVGLPALTLKSGGRIAAAVVTRGKSEKVVQALKGVGDAVKAIKGAPAPKGTKATRAIATKIGKVAPPTIVPISSAPATTMPGGAPLRGVKRSSPARKKAAAKPKVKRARKAKTPKAKSGRKPPKGGLDLKALSASWKAAGKPGTWAGWIKKNSG